jgi:hypothetical protein
MQGDTWLILVFHPWMFQENWFLKNLENILIII